MKRVCRDLLDAASIVNEQREIAHILSNDHFCRLFIDQHGMGSISKVIPSAARPVYIGEFVRELLKIWRPSRQINQGVCTLGMF